MLSKTVVMIEALYKLENITIVIIDTWYIAYIFIQIFGISLETGEFAAKNANSAKQDPKNTI